MDAPVGPRSFAALMARLGPFEARPRLAVAVSGGRDSLALCLLADDWTRARGGSVLALTVDHGLRPESTAEAHQVAVWLAARGIAHRVLAWRGRKPASGIQAAARAARRALLEAACAEAGILHLLLAHQREDQAETVAFRAARGSGADGLAGMAAIVERPRLRLLRPLLGVPRARLAATLRCAGQPWIDDPSNRDPAYARVRLRQRQSAAEVDAAVRRATAAGTARADREAARADLLARLATFDPGGFVWLDRAGLAALADPWRAEVLRAALLTVGGGDYGPRGARLARLAARLDGFGGFAGATLGGCRVVPHGPGGGALLVCREPAAMAAARSLGGPGPWAWDDRFELVRRGPLPDGLTLGGLGAAGWAALPRALRKRWAGAVPPAARPGLPALRAATGAVWVPRLGPLPADASLWRTVEAALRLGFRPRHPLARPRFALAECRSRLI